MEQWSKSQFDLVLADLRQVWPTTSSENQVVLDRLIAWYVIRRNKAYFPAAPVSSVATKGK